MKKYLVVFVIFIIGLIAGCGSSNPPGNPIITAIAGGEGHSLALTSTGLLYAWGLNNHGQLGNGNTTNTNTPIQISLPAGVTFTALAAGEAHSAALTSTGQVYTWGWNQYGQLGIGSTTESHTMVLVPNLNNVIAISARHSHTVVLKNDGTVWAWGKNEYGQIGNGNTTDQKSPVQVKSIATSGAFLANIQAVATGRDHTVALTQGGEIYAWGGDAFGQLGNCTTSSGSSYPVKVTTTFGGSALASINAIAAGSWHTLARKTNGDIYAWGCNTHGQLSQPIPVFPDPNYNVIPTKISGYDINITGAAIDAGWNYSVGLLSGGKVCGWGTNGNGELGIEATGDHESPIFAHLPSGVNASFMTAGSAHMMIVTPSGSLYVWGGNLFGQLGIGNNTNSLLPVQVNF